MHTETAITDNPSHLSSKEKWLAGFLLIFFTIASILAIVAYWPDQLPAPGKSGRYENKPFNIHLLDSYHSKAPTDSPAIGKAKTNATAGAKVNPEKTSKDTKANPDKAAKDTTVKLVAGDSAATLVKTEKKAEIKPDTISTTAAYRDCNKCTIHLNTLLLILVAAGGFLGNMIYISSSFTTFVGANKFKKSWILWYCVKPFTASGLALIVYFVFRAGYLNSFDANSINLYGVMTTSALAGLFTDSATQKLKEVFGVIFKPKDNRPDKLVDTKIISSSVKPDKLDLTQPNAVAIQGTDLDKKKLLISMNDTLIKDAVISATSITFNYTIPEADKGQVSSYKLVVSDETGTKLLTKIWTV